MGRSLFQTLPRLFAATDEQMMWRAATQDDGAAFGELVKRWEQPIRCLCERMIGDGHRAEDLTQETFARVFAHRRDYQETARFSTFLWRIALNQCFDELRRRQRRGELSLEPDDDDAAAPVLIAPDPSPDAQLEQQECAAAIREAVLALPEHYRSVVVLRHYENLKFREIAEVLDIAEGTAKSRMAEALSQLHRRLSEWNHEDGRKTEETRKPESLIV